VLLEITARHRIHGKYLGMSIPVAADSWFAGPCGNRAALLELFAFTPLPHFVPKGFFQHERTRDVPRCY